MSNDKDNIRIAKNTIIVYMRLMITAAVGLLTSRFVLQLLGASDYGLYAVIGGVIAMFTFISGSLQATTVRFINYEVGKSNGVLVEVFSTARQIHMLFAIAIFVIAEVVGMFYISHFLNVDIGKMDDAYFVFHVSVVAACLGIINIPRQGLLIAHEKFLHVACVDIISSLLKLLMVLGLFYIHGNTLRLYALGMSFLTIMSFIAYLVLCWHQWPSLMKFRLSRDADLQKKMLIFNSYTLLSTASLIGRNQGSNLLINYFFGTISNAAYSISNTVHVYVNTFAGSFDQASAPQITQSLSRGDMERALFLVNHTCRVCILLVEIVFFTLIADLNFVLHIWLGDNVPAGTVTFCYLTLLLAVVSATSGGLSQFIIGIGKLRKFSITVAVLYTLALVVGMLMYIYGFEPYCIIVLFLVADSINRVFQLVYLHQLVAFPVLSFLKEAYFRPSIVFIIGVLAVYVYQMLPLSATIQHWFLLFVLAVFMLLVISFVGLSRHERKKIKMSFVKRIGK